MMSNRLNLFPLMIHIYKKELDEIDIKLKINKFIKVKESRITALGCINCEYLFALVYLFLQLNPFFSLFSLSIPHEIFRKS